VAISAIFDLTYFYHGTSQTKLPKAVAPFIAI